MTDKTELDLDELAASGFTEGPWSFYADSVAFDIEKNALWNADNYSVIDVVDYGFGPYMELAEADANLIAAAPSLLSLAISQREEITRLKKDKADAIFFASKLEDEIARLKAEIAEKDERIAFLERRIENQNRISGGSGSQF